MKNLNSKKILLYILIIFLSLLIVGLIGAIIRLINIPAIIITVIITSGLIYSKKLFWFQKILQNIFQIKSVDKADYFKITSKKQAAGKSLKSIDKLIELINDKVKAKALKDEKERVSLELDRGDIS